MSCVIHLLVCPSRWLTSYEGLCVRSRLQGTYWLKFVGVDTERKVWEGCICNLASQVLGNAYKKRSTVRTRNSWGEEGESNLRSESSRPSRPRPFVAISFDSPPATGPRWSKCARTVVEVGGRDADRLGDADASLLRGSLPLARYAGLLHPGSLLSLSLSRFLGLRVLRSVIFKCFRLTLTSNLMIVLQGFRSFVWTAVSYQMKDILKLSPSASQFVVSVAHSPWSIKPIYGY